MLGNGFCIVLQRAKNNKNARLQPRHKVSIIK
jgi:hypothetical protein